MPGLLMFVCLLLVSYVHLGWRLGFLLNMKRYVFLLHLYSLALVSCIGCCFKFSNLDPAESFGVGAFESVYSYMYSVVYFVIIM